MPCAALWPACWHLFGFSCSRSHSHPTATFTAPGQTCPAHNLCCQMLMLCWGIVNTAYRLTQLTSSQAQHVQCISWGSRSVAVRSLFSLQVRRWDRRPTAAPDVIVGRALLVMKGGSCTTVRRKGRPRRAPSHPRSSGVAFRTLPDLHGSCALQGAAW